MDHLPRPGGSRGLSTRRSLRARSARLEVTRTNPGLWPWRPGRRGWRGAGWGTFRYLQSSAIWAGSSHGMWRASETGGGGTAPRQVAESGASDGYSGVRVAGCRSSRSGRQRSPVGSTPIVCALASVIGDEWGSRAMVRPGAAAEGWCQGGWPSAAAPATAPQVSQRAGVPLPPFIYPLMLLLLGADQAVAGQHQVHRRPPRFRQAQRR